MLIMLAKSRHRRCKLLRHPVNAGSNEVGIHPFETPVIAGAVILGVGAASQFGWSVAEFLLNWELMGLAKLLDIVPDS